MTLALPSPNPALPDFPNPYFQDNSFVRGDQQRANNGFVWANLEYLMDAITASVKLSKEISKEIGEPFFWQEYKVPTIWNPATPETYFPAICLDTIDGSTSISATNYPDLVPWLRSRRAVYAQGTASEVNQFTVTVSGTTVTMPDTPAGNAMIRNLAEDNLFVGSYAEYRTANLDGTDYRISASINPVTRQFEIPSAPGNGTYTLIIYTNRIVGSTTTARLYRADGLVLASANDPDQEYVAGLFSRDRFQGHRMNLPNFVPNDTTSGATTGLGIIGTSQISTTGDPVTDNLGNGTPRTGKTTRENRLNGHIYLWARRYTP
jgi:hypothetical protein